MLPQAVEVRVFFRAPIKKLSLVESFFVGIIGGTRNSTRKFDYQHKAYGGMPVAVRQCAPVRPSFAKTKVCLLQGINKKTPLYEEFFCYILRYYLLNKLVISYTP